MKLILETTGPWSLHQPGNAGDIHRLRPTVVENTNFVQTQVAWKQARILATDLPDEATDAEFKKFWLESGKDKELAIESFKSSFLIPDPRPPGPKDIMEAIGGDLKRTPIPKAKGK